jgi:hypothetical protein
MVGGRLKNLGRKESGEKLSPPPTIPEIFRVQ